MRIRTPSFMTGVFGILFMLFLMPGAWAAGGLQVDMHHLVLRPGLSGLEVHERVILKNPGGEAVAGTSLYLPEGYKNLKIPSGELREEKGQLLTGPVLPGINNYSFSYALEPSTGPHFRITMRPQVPTAVLVVLAPIGQVELVGNDLQEGEIMAMGDTRYQMYVLDNPVPGETVEMTAVLQPGGGKTKATPPPAFSYQGIKRLWHASAFGKLNLLLLLALLLSPLGLLAYRRLTSRGSSENSVTRKEEELKTREKVLLDKIVELDKRRNEGAIPEEDYRLRREIYKQKLIKVKAELRSMSD